MLSAFGAEALAGAGAMCRDINGSSIETGQFYVPGPKPCTICVCVNGNPTYCKAVLCKYKDQESLPNKDCKTFRFGSNCCELICLDDTLSSTTNDGTDLNPELRPLLLGYILAVIIGTFFIVSIILFLHFRLKKREQQNSHIADDQRSLGSMGYLDRNSLQHGMPMDDLPCNGGYPLWKPPSNYFPRGEAPPPYEEAVAAARAEQALLSMNQNTLSPLNFSNAYLMEHTAHTNISLVTNSQNGLPASSPTLSPNNASSTSPLISAPTNRPLSSPAAHSCYQSNQTEVAAPDFCSGACSTSFAAGTNIYENLPIPVNRSALSSSASNITVQNNSSPGNQRLQPSPQNSAGQSYRQTTLPRLGGAFTISATLSNAQAGVHRTIPRNLATSGSLRLRGEYSVQRSVDPFNSPLTSRKNNAAGNASPSPRAATSSTGVASNVPSTFSSGKGAVRTNAFFDMDSHSQEKTSTPAKTTDTKSKDASTSLCNYKPPLAAANEVNEEGSFDSVTCTCSGQVLPPLHDETDDYRSECENCKSASGSRFYLDNEDELVTSPHETMTLQRRPEDAASGSTPQYYRTSLTLPTNTRSRTRNSRGNWFSSMPESSTESSDGE
ncbi:uncharacterized protein LOC106645972 [Copidosoma floridanum]|uniref:uncharacterized protein LOC106645972 n=1 Tax=Copidosoma floridanum TaxID=29053 RepID=UPI0006C93D27|nr:uncharacterized protein LOC106645972 [Copidosoma floridanum]